jgi:hypothetical protein
MEKIIKEELERIKSLLNTQTEVAVVRLNESILSTLAKDAKGAEGLAKELEVVLPKIKGGIGPAGAQLRTVEDLLTALRTEAISAADLGKINFELLRTTKDAKLANEISKDIVSQKSFISKYSSGTAAERLANLKLNNPKLAKENPDLIRRLHQANELRLKNVANKAEKIVQGGKGAEEVLQGSKGVEDATRGTQNVHVNVNVGSIRDEKEFARRYGPEIDDFARTYGKEADDLARENGHSSFSKWMQEDAEGAMASVRERSKSGKGLWGRFIDWTKRRIKWKALWGLAKIAGVSYAIWWLFFKKDGFTVECPSGQHFEEGKGCVGKIEDEGGGGGGNTDNGDQGGGKITDNQGNTYTECSEPYYKGCVGRKGDDSIRKAQDCLGVTPNGFFNQETEDALSKKINKKSFSSSDLPTICARSLGTQRYQY